MRCALLVLAFLLIVAPAKAEIRVVDTSAGATSVPGPRSDLRLHSWVEDGSALRVQRIDLRRLSLATGLLTRQAEWLPYAESIGPRVAGSPLFLALEDVYQPGVAWSHDGGRMAIATRDGLRVLDTNTGATLL